MVQRLRELDDASQFIIVVELTDGPLLGGWLHAAERRSLETGFRVEIAGLVVDAACRRQGVGAALVAAAEVWARSRRAPGVVVRSNAARIESHEFYPALGYERLKTQHQYWKWLP